MIAVGEDVGSISNFTLFTSTLGASFKNWFLKSRSSLKLPYPGNSKAVNRPDKILS